MKAEFVSAVARLWDRDPIIGAVIGVRGWNDRGAGLSFRIHGEHLDERGWNFLREIAGDEAVEIVERHRRFETMILAGTYLDDIPVTPGDPARTLEGVRVYFVDGPSPRQPIYFR